MLLGVGETSPLFLSIIGDMMAISVTGICNMALGRIGAKRINDFGDASDIKPEAIQCRLHYEQTRDALIRSHYWRFASVRAALSQDTNDPAFEWDNQFILPNDFMRLKSVFSDNFTVTENTRFSFAIEGQRLLTNESSVKLRYIKKVTDPTEFDALFIELLVLTLADKFIGPLAGGDAKIQEKIDRAMGRLLPSVRSLDRQETNNIGIVNRRTWNDARASNLGRVDSQLGS